MMEAIITAPFFTGLGDMYSNIYYLYYRQEELKKKGYDVKVIISCQTNGYTTVSSIEDCYFLGRIFDLSVFDNLIVSTELDTTLGNFTNYQNYKIINNYLNFLRCYVEITNPINSLDLIEFNDIDKKDDLPKWNLLSNEVRVYCENYIKRFPKNFNVIHFRCGDKTDVEYEFNKYKKDIDDFVSNSDNNIIFLTTSEKIKNLMIDEKYNNVFFNEYPQGELWTKKLNGEELVNYLKNILVDMCLISHAEKIKRLGIFWFSNFLFFGTTNNQTLISNKLRFI